jgi:hypothetical protein
LYRQKHVCETLMSLFGTSHSHVAAALAGSGSGGSSSAPQLVPAAACGGQQGLDGCAAQVLRQALCLPGLAAHLVRAAGVLPWLSGIAAQQLQQQQLQPAQDLGDEAVAASVPAGSMQAAATSCTAAAVHATPWAVACLQQLLRGRTGLRQGPQLQQQLGDAAYSAYCQAVVGVAAAALLRAEQGVAGGLITPGPVAISGSSSSSSPPPRVVVQLLQLLVLLLQAAPSARAARQAKQQLQSGLLLQQLGRAVQASCEHARRPVEAEALAAVDSMRQLWQQLWDVLAP